MRLVNALLVLLVLVNAGLIFGAAADRGRLDTEFLVYFGGIMVLALGALVFARKRTEKGPLPKVIGLLAAISVIINSLFFVDIIDLGATAMLLVLLQIATGLLITYKCFPAIRKFIATARELNKKVDDAIDDM